MMIKSQYDMIFYPQELDLSPASLKADEPPELDHLIRQLQTEGFIGNYFSTRYAPHKETLSGYFIGDNFLKLITFLGCSPHIEVVIPEQIEQWRSFCYIEIQYQHSPVFFKGLNKPKCSCPVCRARITQALPDMQQWTPAASQVVCPKCQTTSWLEDLNWRHSAGFGQLFLIVHSVYPNEAVPTDKLMNLLDSEVFKNWEYFYSEE